MKILIRFLLLLAFYLLGWFALSQINWVGIFKVEEKKDKIEERLGELIREEIERAEEVLKDEDLNKKLDSMLSKIAEANNLKVKNAELLLVQNDMVNAFALPSDYIVVHSGLILECENEEMLMGVIAHELAHLEHNHVMKKLVKEIGISVLASTVSGNGGGIVLNQLMSTLSSTAFDRSMESEADEYAVKYLLKAKIDPRPLADFFYLLSIDEPSFANQVSWLSTHPSSEDRALNITENRDLQAVEFDDLMSEVEWSSFQKEIKEIVSLEN